MSRTFPIVVLLASTFLGGGGGYLANAAVRRFAALPDGESVSRPVVDGGDAVADATPVGASTPRVTTRPDKTYRDELLCRNLFDVSKVGDCPTDDGGDSGVDCEADPDNPACQQAFTGATLLGTLVAEPARFSSALIQPDGEDRAHGYSIDDMIGSAKILEIRAKEVVILNDGKRETLRMGDVDAPAPKPAAAKSDDKGGDDEVRKTGENSFAIDRSTMDKYLNDLESIGRMGRALLHRGPDGEFDGYRLSAIRRGTIADKLGIRNGDIIHSVNGQGLTSMQAAMGAYQTMQNDSNFEFEVTRRGQKVKLSYAVE